MLILYACVIPVSVKPFINDERIQDIIETSKEKVTIHVDSDDYDELIAGGGKISGLDPGKYYMIEKVEDTEGNPVTGYPKYVSDLPGPGRLSDYLGGITTISGGVINRLTSFFTYTVRTAQPFPNGPLTYTETGGSGGTVTVSNGKIDIIPQGTNVKLNLTGTLIPGTNYEIIAVAVPYSDSTPPSWSFGNHQSIYDNNWNELPLEGQGKTVDYVIVKVDGSGNPVVPVVSGNFMVLRVEVKEKETVAFTVTFTAPTDATVTPASPAISYGAVDGGAPVTFTLGAAPTGVTFDNTTIQWYVDSTLVGTGSNTLVIDAAFLDANHLFSPGDTVEITVMVDTTGAVHATYSKEVAVTIGP